MMHGTINTKMYFTLHRFSVFILQKTHQVSITRINRLKVYRKAVVVVLRIIGEK